MTDQTISTPETREREVAALKHQVRDMANERNKAEQDVRDLRAEVEWLKQENARIISVARPYENNLNELRAQLAQVERECRDMLAKHLETISRQSLELAAMTQDYEAACHLAESTSNEWKANKQQLAASEARVKDLEDALRQISGKTREEFYTCVGIANKALAKGKETL